MAMLGVGAVLDIAKKGAELMGGGDAKEAFEKLGKDIKKELGLG